MSKPCGCKIRRRDEVRRLIDESDFQINYCPLHAAAGKMLEALKSLRVVMYGSECFDRCLKSGGLTFHSAACEKAAKAISQAEGRRPGND